MITISVSKARAALGHLIEEAAEGHVPVKISGKRHDAVLISAADWASIQETRHLQPVPGMTESINKGVQTPLDKCYEELR